MHPGQTNDAAAVWALKRRFRLLTAATLVFLVTVLAFGQQADAHAVPHSQDQVIAAGLLDSKSANKTDASDVCCHIGAAGVACVFFGMSANTVQSLSLLRAGTFLKSPKLSNWRAGLDHAPPNPPPIPLPI